METKDKIKWAVNHLRCAAESTVEPHIGLWGIVKNGESRVEMAIEAHEFLEDLATVLGLPPITDDDRDNYKADSILGRLN
jgi:hypothetical protein